MKKYTPEELIRKYVEGTCTEEEKALVESWHLKELAESTHTPTEAQITAAHERTRAAIALHIHTAKQKRAARPLWYRLAAAAVLVFVVGGWWFVVDRRGKEQHAQETAEIKDILPGRDGAILTLADGSRIVLDSAGNGSIALQKGIAITKQGARLIYKATDSGLPTSDSRLKIPDSRLAYNTISTPRGRQFQVVLPDGTRVWLNAASSLRYPVAFTGAERRVAVTGEVYFEVSLLPTSPPAGGGGVKGKMPFIVSINGKAEVEVLGTHFNINAYDDEESIRTTLLEGSVKVKSDASSQTSGFRPPASIVLKPGEQAIAAAHSPLTIDHSPDIEKVMAWKNGFFNFQDASLVEVMRQLARWYDIEVVYEKGIPAIAFEGEMNRGNSLRAVLKSLEGLGVHFRLVERRLVVLP
jgi:transmembrane sensor